jgi:hypothetical protein
MLVIHHVEQIRRANASRSIKVNDDLMEQMTKRLVKGRKVAGWRRGQEWIIVPVMTMAMVVDEYGIQQDVH